MHPIFPSELVLLTIFFMTDILISNPQLFNEKLKNIITWWPEHFHVIADFDRTLTKAFAEGKPTVSLITRLQNWFYPPEYAEKSNAIFDKYHPIEIDSTIPLDEKKKAMEKRWDEQFALMLDYGLTRKIIEDAIASEETNFRLWCGDFFDLLYANAIPLLILSASGLGYDSIYYCLQHEHKLYDNIDIISNDFVWDESWKAIGVREPIIHSFNKDETIVKNFPIYDEIKDRKNILLLGDGLWDAEMANGFDYENIIKIWFLNNDTPENREKFQKTFDVVILGDGAMEEVNAILKKILAI